MNTCNDSYYPEHMIIEVSSRCNLKCLMCASNTEPRILPGGAWYGDIAMQVIDNLEGVFGKIRRVDLNGHGESLMNRHFLEIFSRVRSKAKIVGFTTNALMIDEQIARQLVEGGMEEIIISIHAADPALYHEISRPGHIEDLIAVVNLLNSLKDSSQLTKPVLRFQMVGMKKNAQELTKLVELAAAMRVESVNVLALAEYPLVVDESLDNKPEIIAEHFTPAQRRAEELGVYLSLPANYLEVLQEQMPITATPKRSYYAKLVSLWCRFFKFGNLDAGQSAVDNGLPEVTSRATLLGRLYKEDGDNTIVRECIDPWTFSFVLQSGQVRLCCVSEEMMGDLNDQDFDQIWFGDKYQHIRKQILKNSPPKECMNCVIRPSITTLGALKARVNQITKPKHDG